MGLILCSAPREPMRSISGQTRGSDACAGRLISCLDPLAEKRWEPNRREIDLISFADTAPFFSTLRQKHLTPVNIQPSSAASSRSSPTVSWHGRPSRTQVMMLRNSWLPSGACYWVHSMMRTLSRDIPVHPRTAASATFEGLFMVKAD